MAQMLGDRMKGRTLDEGIAFTKKFGEEKESPQLPAKEKAPKKPLAEESSSVTSSSDYLMLENISCVDADGVEFERYDRLYVPKDIERDAKGGRMNKKPYDWISYFEQDGMALPSFALSCNILASLWENRNNPECMQVLMQYKEYGAGYGWHCQNTLVNWGAGQVIHYPLDSDFTSDGGNSNVNEAKRLPLEFGRDGIKECFLQDALKMPEMERFVKQLTGLRNPEVLIQVRDFFRKPAYVRTSNSDETRAAWFGCLNGGFFLEAIGFLDYSGAARGVREQL